MCTGVRTSPAGSELRDLLDHPRGVAGDDGAGRHVVDDDRPGAHQRPLPDLDPRQDRAVGADARQAAHHGAPLAVLVARAAHRVRVVGEDDVGTDEDVVLDGHELEEAAAVDTDAAADPIAELEHGVGADADVVAEGVVLADARSLPGLQAGADRAPGIDGRERPYDRAGADGERTLALLGAARLACRGCTAAAGRRLAAKGDVRGDADLEVAQRMGGGRWGHDRDPTRRWAVRVRVRRCSCPAPWKPCCRSVNHSRGMSNTPCA